MSDLISFLNLGYPREQWRDLRLFLLAKHNQTYLPQARQTRPDLLGSQLPSHNVAYHQEVGLYRCQHCTLHISICSYKRPTSLYTLQYSSFASPPDKPPIAIPGVSLLIISLVQISRNLRSRPPWIIQKRFCLSGCLWAAMHRSSHLTERSMASSILFMSGEVTAMTSSSCIMMSDPIEFCREMECSGVSSLVGG